jgi:hypothetical protein
MDIAKDRPEALSLGLKLYYGNVCNHCSTNVKRVKKYDCLECHKKARKSHLKTYRQTAKGRAYRRTQKVLRDRTQRQAMPPWADREEILRIYLKAREEGMHVDHIVPLNHGLVCGLHNQFNLQLLPPAENIAKSNHFEVL